MFADIYQNRRVLVTGHTGFKGSWLALWLQLMGAKVSGIALPCETSPSHWDLLSLDIESLYIDIRDTDRLKAAIHNTQPEIVFHLAAQPLVRRSYQQPLETWTSNVIGTANVLDACRGLPSLKSIVIVTTDKCYKNQEWVWGYRETDTLGGHDPYSASKAGAELVAASYRDSFFNDASSPLLATARAGNVIGGGDWSEDRLIPDLVRAVTNQKILEIRSPHATRPWQHVLECLSGYLILGQRLFEGHKANAESWNFGPERNGNRSVLQVLEQLKLNWNQLAWRVKEQIPALHEAQLLHLDSAKARDQLLWQPVWTFEEGISASAEWYQSWLRDRFAISTAQLHAYTQVAQKRGLAWAQGTAL